MRRSQQPHDGLIYAAPQLGVPTNGRMMKYRGCEYPEPPAIAKSSVMKGLTYRGSNY